MSFLEYGTPEQGTPNAVERAQDQVKAAVLEDVEKLSHLEIAARLGIDVNKDKYRSNMRIPEVDGLIKAGGQLLSEVLRGEGGWLKRVAEMKAEGERYNKLSKEDKEIEWLAKNMGWTVEEARSRYGASAAVRFLARIDYRG